MDHHNHNRFFAGMKAEDAEEIRLHGRPSSSSTVNTKIMVAAVVVLFIVVLFILILHIYARWFWRNARLGSRPRVSWASGRFRRRRRIMTRFDFTEHQVPGVHITNRGLDKCVLESLPVFFYTRMKKDAGEDTGVTEDGLDCAVCLSEFEDNEAGRRLPRCNHVFHTECIDMWFSSHSTCPLCRSSVLPDPPQGMNHEEIAVMEEHGQQPDSRSQGERLLQESVVSGLNAMAIQILHDEGSFLLTGPHQDHIIVNIPPSSQVPVSPRSGPPSVLDIGSPSDPGLVKSPRHLVIEVPRRSGGIMSSGCSSQLASPTGTDVGQRSPLGTHLRNIRRLLSRDSRRSSIDDSCEPVQTCHTPGSVSGCQTPTSQC